MISGGYASSTKKTKEPVPCACIPKFLVTHMRTHFGDKRFACPICRILRLDDRLLSCTCGRTPGRSLLPVPCACIPQLNERLLSRTCGRTPGRSLLPVPCARMPRLKKIVLSCTCGLTQARNPLRVLCVPMPRLSSSIL